MTEVALTGAIVHAASAADPVLVAVQDIRIGAVLLYGLASTAILTSIMSLAQGLHLSRMSLPLMLGSAFTPDRDRAMVVGSALHFVNGWWLAFLYALMLDSVGGPGWLVGAGLGVVHALFVLVFLLPVLPHLHPRMATPRQGPTPTRRLQPPGFMAIHYGWGSPAASVVAHLLYGAVFGLLYRGL